MNFSFVLENAERFKAEVRNAFGVPVYRIDGREIIQSAIMQREDDVEGLTKYLRKRKVIQYDDSIEMALA